MERVSAAPRAFVGHLRETAEMIKIEHTVFALPFAAIALVTAAGRSWPAPRVWLWVLVAMVAARTEIGTRAPAAGRCRREGSAVRSLGR